MIKIISVEYFKKECNTNNHNEYFPVEILDENKIKIDKKWFNKLTYKTKKRLHAFISKYELDNLKFPHNNYKSLNESQLKLWYNIYHCYLQQYDFTEYADFYNKDYVKIDISKNNLAILHKVCKVVISTNTSTSWINTQFEDLSEEFILQIINGLKKYDNYCFIKTNKTSGKNEISLTPKSTYLDVLNHLTNCKEYYIHFNRALDKYKLGDTENLIISKWRDDFDKYREFRVIILDGKIKGISQQLWYEKIIYSEEEILKISNAIIEFFNQNKFYVPDMTVDINVNIKYHVDLIECNPGGLYSSSGSSLFHWINDYDKLYDNTDITYFIKYN
ncbi:hypothetical protein crov369 [Cafeteria roenbergensis virus]|uniref:Cell division cycle 123 protein n=1 Tax=Cafeteria roenbergensis virus (strain BV-PW1) TaxID=693272 RepID=E3T5E0_CROVB|nr:hypothetical protein crov369 [Cafeteria roenbergensis virus BV-PW1]ADO67403.1 hypothetical protein crov369 [Cafeteria roenbergensis virus BV-PW1]